MYELCQSRGLLPVHGFYIFMHVSMLVFVATFVQRCLEDFSLNCMRFSEFLGWDGRESLWEMVTVSMKVASRDVLSCVKRQLSLTHRPCCTNTYSIKHK